MNFKKFPKVLLHLHLDGSLNKSLIKKMTSKSIDEINDLCVCNSSDSLTDYLEKFSYPCELLQNKRSLYLFTKRLCKDLKEENVLYAEIRFAPNKHVNKELSYDDVIKSVLKGLKGTNYKLILCMMRNDDDNLNKKIINLYLWKTGKYKKKK